LNFILKNEQTNKKLGQLSPKKAMSMLYVACNAVLIINVAVRTELELRGNLEES
jgi:hypothetical protein